MLPTKSERNYFYSDHTSFIIFLVVYIRIFCRPFKHLSHHCDNRRLVISKFHTYFNLSLTTNERWEKRLTIQIFKDFVDFL